MIYCMGNFLISRIRMKLCCMKDYILFLSIFYFCVKSCIFTKMCIFQKSNVIEQLHF